MVDQRILKKKIIRINESMQIITGYLKRFIVRKLRTGNRELARGLYEEEDQVGHACRA
jgi:hypothetical protein